MSIFSQRINLLKLKASYRQYLLITAGPFFVLGALIAFLSKWSVAYSVISLLVMASLPLIWKYQIKGALMSLLVTLATFFSVVTLQEDTLKFSWLLLWCLSNCISMLLAGFCSKYFHDKQELAKEEEEKAALELKRSFESKESKLKSELLHVEDEKTHLEESVKKKETEIHSFKKLMMASKEEGDKYYMQAEHLSSEIKELQKTVGLIESQRVKLEHLEMKNRSLQKKLNDERVNHYQKKLIVEELQKKETKPKLDLPSPEVLTKIETLKQERKELVNRYEESVQSYETFKEKLKELVLHHAFDQESSDLYPKYKESFLSSAKVLHQMRNEIFKIEGQIIELKGASKALAKDASLKGYLMIADQECLRLEKENSLFFELLMESIALINETKPLSESHSHSQ